MLIFLCLYLFIIELLSDERTLQVANFFDEDVSSVSGINLTNFEPLL